MADYRVYRLNRDGHIMRGDYITVADDEGAIRAMREQRLAVDCEIWLGNRKVAFVPAGGGEPRRHG